MKLIYCNACKDIVRICNSRIKFCRCKKSAGQYTDNTNAWYAGDDCVPLGIQNKSFADALYKRRKASSSYGEQFEAFVVPTESDTFKRRTS